VFETVLGRCIEEGLVGGEGFAVDASLIKADANRQRGVEGTQGLPRGAASRAIDEYMAVLDHAAFGAATDATPKFVSPADPAARWTGAHGGLAFFALAFSLGPLLQCLRDQSALTHRDTTRRQRYRAGAGFCVPLQ
jgi:hypothetical protein